MTGARAGKRVQPGGEARPAPTPKQKRTRAAKATPEDQRLLAGVRMALVDERQVDAALAALGLVGDGDLDARVVRLNEHFLAKPEPEDGYEECDDCGGIQDQAVTAPLLGEACAYCGVAPDVVEAAVVEPVVEAEGEAVEAVASGSIGEAVLAAVEAVPDNWKGVTSCRVEVSRLLRTAQSRALREDVVAEYAEAMRAGDVFPAVEAIYAPDGLHLVDGYHRAAAAELAGVATLLVEIQQGGLADAILAAVAANTTHGLRRTENDKRSAVRLLLSQGEWRKRSDRSVAKACRVSHPLVAGVRRELEGAGEEPQVRTGDDGKARRLPKKRTPEEQAAVSERHAREGEELRADAAAEREKHVDQVTVMAHAKKHYDVPAKRTKAGKWSARVELDNDVTVRVLVTPGDDGKGTMQITFTRAVTK